MSACKRCKRPLGRTRRHYCDACKGIIERERARQRARRRSSNAARGYGAEHRRLRDEWAPQVAAGVVTCSRCGLTIAAGEDWDLGHDDRDRTRWTGPEHAACNRSAAATMQAAGRRRPRSVREAREQGLSPREVHGLGITSREW